jgi:hypothetical protein
MYATGDRAHLLDVKTSGDLVVDSDEKIIMYFAASDQIKQSRGIA